jgi:hypothetical protein
MAGPEARAELFGGGLLVANDRYRRFPSAQPQVEAWVDQHGAVWLAHSAGDGHFSALVRQLPLKRTA